MNMKKSQLKALIKEILTEVSSDAWTEVGQKPPKNVSTGMFDKKTYDEPCFGDNKQLPLRESNSIICPQCKNVSSLEEMRENYKNSDTKCKCSDPHYKCSKCECIYHKSQLT